MYTNETIFDMKKQFPKYIWNKNVFSYLIHVWTKIRVILSLNLLPSHYTIHFESMNKRLLLFCYKKIHARRHVTLKKAPVDPDSTQPYLILVCFAKSSADSIGDAILSTVKNAAKFAV